jgi:hypothetical protein
MTQPCPVEVEDDHVFHDHLDETQTDTVPLIKGVNMITLLYLSSTMSKSEPPSANDLDAESKISKDSVLQAIRECRQIILNGPAELSGPVVEGPEKSVVDMDPTEKRSVQLNTQKIAVQMVSMECIAHLAILLQGCNDAQAEATEGLSMVAHDMAFLLKPLKVSHIQTQMSSFMGKLDGTIKEAMLRIVDSNSDAAYVLARTEEIRAEILSTTPPTDPNLGSDIAPTMS